MLSKISNAAACLSLSAALIGCREERTIPGDVRSQGIVEPVAVYSLPEARGGAEGTRVYLTSVTLKPISSPSNRVDEAHYEVIDRNGERMVGILNAPSDSFLWKLTPFDGERGYSDFGGTLRRIDGATVLFIFKLAN